MSSKTWPNPMAIGRGFVQSRSTYEESSSFHRKMTKELFKVAPTGLNPARVLEIGSHTGSTSKAIAKRWPSVQLVTLDLQVEPTLGTQHVRGDGEALPFRRESFSAVLSGSTFQWFKEPRQALRGIWETLEPGAHLGFSQFIQPSLEPFASTLEEVAGGTRFLPLLKSEELRSQLDDLGELLHFSVEEETKAFADIRELHRYIKNMGVGAPAKGQPPLSRSQYRELKIRLCRNTEKTSFSLQFCGALVWLRKA